MSQQEFNRGLCKFLDGSPTPFHAVSNLSATLLASGFRPLDESAAWKLKPGNGYFVTRNGSSLITFRVGKQSPVTTGLRLVGAHTDSPCLKVKPSPEIKSHGYWQLGVEVYGGALLNPWFDRDLSLAGRVTLRQASGALLNRLIDFETAVACIPSLAIHLDRQANESRTINKQTYLPALVACAEGQDFSLKQAILERLAGTEPELEDAEVLDFELSFYDLQRAAQVGLRQEFIAAARLDNLLSCYCGLRALVDAETGGNQVLVCNDHEEVGSGSTVGARGTFLRSVVERLTGSGEDYSRAIANSLLVSTDNAHGVHPNFPERHDGNHGPLLNGGPAIKVNHNQSYASNSETVGIFKDVCARAKVKTQTFVTRGDMPCGSTIGPLTATTLGVRTVDVGVPTFAMHSIRELAGSADAAALHRALVEFYALEDLRIR